MHPIFQSKRFWSALIGLLTVVLVGFFPELEDNMDMIQETALVLFGALIGGYSVQDAVSAARKPAMSGDSPALVGDEVKPSESADTPPDAQKPRSKIKM